MSVDEKIYKVISANRLGDGAVVYLTCRDGGFSWCNAIAQASVFDEEHLATAQAFAREEIARNRVVEPYEVEITGHNEPITEREKIRAGGPSVAYGDAAHAPKQPDFAI
jgi:hypothetical protein